MAEIFGIAAGIVGFISLADQLRQITQSLRRIRAEADKAPTKLTNLTNQVEFLVFLIEHIDVGLSNCSRGSILVEQTVQTHCHEVVLNLQQLEQMLRRKLGAKLQSKKPKIITFRNWVEELENLEQSIAVARESLILTMSFITYNNTLPNHQTQTMSLEGQQVNSLDQEATPMLEPDGPSSAQITTEHREVTNSIRPLRRWNCETRHCSCSCHRTARIGSRFWILEYSPFTSRQICDNAFCSGAKYQVGMKVALSQLGIKRLAAVQFHVGGGAGSLSLGSSLTMERIVPYTSPGFEILYRAKYGEIDFEEARNKLVALRNSDPSFKDHVNPSGRSYIEELVRYPGCRQSSDVCGFLQLFIKELEITKGIENLGFLVHCAKWIGEGPHLDLLDCILELGYDATTISSPNVKDWPLPCSPGWISEEYTPDPFFIEYLGLLCRDNQGWGMMSPLHEAILSSDTDLVAKWISRSKKNERNFLGQTPVHLAVLDPRHLDSLIQAGHDVQVVDHYGVTPLMYAAAMNQEKSVILLIGAGARLGTRDARHQRNFVHYAACRGNWNLMMPILNKVNTMSGQESSESLAEFMTFLSFAEHPDWRGERRGVIAQLLSSCGSVNFTFDDENSGDNTLLHYANSVADVELLLGNGFNKVNHENSLGETAIFAAVRRVSNTDLIEKLIDSGVNVNHKDRYHHTALYYLLGKLTSSVERNCWKAMDAARVLLAHGADCMYRDDCRCSCSPEGCLPAVALPASVHVNWLVARTPVWSLEWLSSLLEERGELEAKSLLLTFIRRFKHQEMDMTHVCQHSSEDFSIHGTRRCIPDDDIDEILEEESEFGDILESEMSESSSKTFQALLHDWILLIKTSFDKVQRDTSEHNETPAQKNALWKPSITVDHKRDRFVHSTFQIRAKPPISGATSHVAEYVCWLERRYHSSKDPANEAVRENWRRSRFSWLHQLISSLGLSVEEIVKDMRRLSKSHEEIRWEPV